MKTKFVDTNSEISLNDVSYDTTRYKPINVTNQTRFNNHYTCYTSYVPHRNILSQAVKSFYEKNTAHFNAIWKEIKDMSASITIPHRESGNHIELSAVSEKMNKTDGKSILDYIYVQDTQTNAISTYTVSYIKENVFKLNGNINSVIVDITLNDSTFRYKYDNLLNYTRFAGNEGIFNSTKTMILNYIDTYIKTVGLYKELVHEVQCRTGDSTVICKNRTIEGKFINDSLSKMRDTIVDIIYERKKDVINFSPNYVDACLTEYCPSKTGCFELPKKRESDPNKINSVIFSHIYEFLKNQKKTGQE